MDYISQAHQRLHAPSSHLMDYLSARKGGHNFLQRGDPKPRVTRTTQTEGGENGGEHGLQRGISAGENSPRNMQSGSRNGSRMGSRSNSRSGSRNGSRHGSQDADASETYQAVHHIRSSLKQGGTESQDMHRTDSYRAKAAAGAGTQSHDVQGFEVQHTESARKMLEVPAGRTYRKQNTHESLNSCARSEQGSGGKRGGVMTSLDESDGDAQGSNAAKPNTLTGSNRESKDFKPRHKANASAKALIQTQRLRSMSKSNLNYQPPTRFPKLSGFCLYVVDHTAFMSLVVLVIFGQSVYMGLEDEGSLVVDVLFTVFYFLELTMRLIAYGSDFFKSAFNLMDLGLIVISFVDLLIVIIRGSSSLDVMVSLRLSRLLRLGGLVRLIRLLRFFKPLYLLVTGIMVSLRTVVWAWLLMSLIIYVFALVFYRALKPDICPGGVAEQDPEQGYFDLMMTYYGSLTLSVFTVFQITTLEDWPQVSDVMSKHHVWLGVMVILLLVLTAYGVMNVTVAIFVNSAMDASSVRSRDIAKKAKEEYEATCKSLYQVFKDADNDGNGTLSKEEFNKAIKEKNLLARLHGAGIDEGSASSLFDILDIDGSGTLDGNEFVEGVLRSRGYAQNKDMVGLRCDVWRANLSVQEEIRQVNVYFEARLLETKQKLENLKEVAGPVLRRAIEEARKKPVKARLSAGPTMTTAEQTTEDHDDSAVAVRPSLKSGFSFEDSH